MSAGSPPSKGSATKANPAKAGDAKPRGYGTPFTCHASRVAELFDGGGYAFSPRPTTRLRALSLPQELEVRSTNEGEGFS